MRLRSLTTDLLIYCIFAHFQAYKFSIRSFVTLNKLSLVEMFMVNNGQGKGSFWARHKQLTDDLFKASCLFISLKLIKAITDRIDV
jgi:hypothetical protein